MFINLWTWGTGGAFGRELGIPSCPERKRRDHSANSFIGGTDGNNQFHFMVDAGGPCVEKMIDKNILTIPDVLFITHTHTDHVSDFDRLANSRRRGRKLLNLPDLPMKVICSPQAADHPVYGLRSKFGYLGKAVSFHTIPFDDVWYSVLAGDGGMVPVDSVSSSQEVYPYDVKAIPVYHGQHAPGASMFVFRFHNGGKRIVVTGDFESIEDEWMNNVDLKDPSAILMEANTIKATGTNHTNLDQNEVLLKRWLSDKAQTRVILTHISGYEDYKDKLYDRIPTDKDWNERVKSISLPGEASIAIADDAMCCRL